MGNPLCVALGDADEAYVNSLLMQEVNVAGIPKLGSEVSEQPPQKVDSYTQCMKSQ